MIAYGGSFSSSEDALDGSAHRTKMHCNACMRLFLCTHAAKWAGACRLGDEQIDYGDGDSDEEELPPLISDSDASDDDEDDAEDEDEGGEEDDEGGEEDEGEEGDEGGEEDEGEDEGEDDGEDEGEDDGEDEGADEGEDD